MTPKTVLFAPSALLILILTLTLIILLLPAAALAGEAPHWTEETLDLAATLPIQDQGRVKPLYTFARYNLMGIAGGSSYRNEAGRKVGAVEWLLDCLFRPEEARKERVILVQTDEVLTGIGVRVEGRKKRDRYSFDEVMAGVEKLFELAEELEKIPARDREPAQEQTILLARNVDTLARLYAGAGGAAGHAGHGGNVLVIFPPPDGRTEWRTAREVLAAAARAPEEWKRQAGLAAILGELPGLVKEPARFGERFRVLHDGLRELAGERGEYGKVRMEVFLFRGAFFHWSLGFFALGFVAVALTWLLPRLRALRLVPPVFLVVAVGALSFGIVLRCVIRERPPVTTLYETLLFITATAVISALVIEAFHRRGIAIAVAAVLGLVGMFLSNRYETGRGEDTMPQLIAVLDTNFWLATHVTTISLGYAAGLLGAAIGHVYLFARLFGFRRDDPRFYRSIGRMMFGVACFTLLFSVVGTLLGGIWANESWGRFWGWDPKENGALMICLWTVAMIHAHLGGLIRDRGLAMASVFGGLVVVFSWWGVNLLGVGLHSYGFTSGILRTLVAIGMVETMVLLTGFIPVREPSMSPAEDEHAPGPEDKSPRGPEWA